MEVNDHPASEDANPEVLARAGRLARAQRPDGWTEVSGRVRGRLRSTMVPAQEFSAYVEAGSRGSSVGVTSRVLLPTLRRRLGSDQRAVEEIDLVADGRRLAGVRVQLVCRYGADLHHEGADVRRLVGEVVGEALGTDPAFEAGRDVGVHVVDVVDGDPRQD